MKIYLKDKLVAKPVVFYLRNVPVLALPFWVFPVKPGRHSGFLFPQFELGLSNSAGQFIRNAGYYWAPNDYMDFTAGGDYYQAEPSWVLRGAGPVPAALPAGRELQRHLRAQRGPDHAVGGLGLQRGPLAGRSRRAPGWWRGPRSSRARTTTRATSTAGRCRSA